LYAALSPDHNILSLIADYFADRMPNECLIIHDQKRKLAIICDGQKQNKDKSSTKSKWYLTDFTYYCEDFTTRGEQYWQELWQLYFHQISIESRYNPRLQSHFVPQRYRRHLVEFQNLTSKTEAKQ